MEVAPTGSDDELGAYLRLSTLCDSGDYVVLAEEARRFVDAHPEHGKAHHLLGFARVCLGAAEQGMEALARAAELLPRDAEVHDHLGAAFNLLGDHPSAADAFARALELDPGRAETWVNAGKNQLDLGNPASAETHYRRALGIRPDLADAHNNLSVVLGLLGRASEALAESEAALAHAPQMATAHLHRGNALRDLGRMDECLQAYDRALMIDPRLSQGWNNLADALCRVGDISQALQAGEKAIRLVPEDLEVMNTVGTLYAIAHRKDEAASLLREVVTRQPNNARAWLNLGNVLQNENERGYCFEQYQHAIELDPELDQGISILLFVLNYAPRTSAQELLTLATRYGDALARRHKPDAAWSNPPEPGRGLRVGLVSGDFCEHPVAYFLEGFLIAAQGKGIEWVAYANVLREDAITNRLRPLFALWRNIRNQPDDEVARRIRNDRIDILIDLSGHTSDSRLPVFARKPAPVQATWLGYVGTTGLPTIDYVIGDPHLFPENEPPSTTETPWRLPECYMSFTPPPFALECGEPPMIEAGYPTFGCFNNLRKINDEVLSLWAEVLREVPDAKLLLRDSLFGNEAMRTSFSRRMAACGVDEARVEITGARATREEGLREYLRVDIALDPFPYTGATTSAEALWMGVPVLTLKGDRMLSRVGESLNRAAGLNDWIAVDRADYVQRAARFAKDAETLRRLRKGLRNRGSASPLGNPDWFSNQFVAAMRGMWRQWCETQ